MDTTLLIGGVMDFFQYKHGVTMSSCVRYNNVEDNVCVGGKLPFQVYRQHISTGNISAEI